MNQRQFNNRLENRGYEMLGSGMYSKVWGKPGSSKVIKVGATSDSWLTYIVWAMSKGYVSNHAPRVDSFKVNGQEGYFVAVMERLRRLNTENCELMRELTPNTREITGDVLEWKTFSKDFTAQFGRYNDLHEGNWLQRANGELVLTDPLSTQQQLTPDRYKSQPKKSASSLRNDPALVWC